jgi:hypothetical protein
MQKHDPPQLNRETSTALSNRNVWQPLQSKYKGRYLSSTSSPSRLVTILFDALKILVNLSVVPVHPVPQVRSPPPIQPQQPFHGYTPAYNPGYTPQAATHAPPQPQYAQNFGQFLGVNDTTAQMGLHVMTNVVGTGQEYVEQNFLRFINTRSLKPYFNVSTSYVLRKLQLLIFPWRHKPWSRQMRRNEVSAAVEGYKPPREDINAPDLYIPGITPP